MCAYIAIREDRLIVVSQPVNLLLSFRDAEAYLFCSRLGYDLLNEVMLRVATRSAESYSS